jgi:hypothetical protein
MDQKTNSRTIATEGTEETEKNGAEMNEGIAGSPADRSVYIGELARVSSVFSVLSVANRFCLIEQ